jgi:dipeptidase
MRDKTKTIFALASLFLALASLSLAAERRGAECFTVLVGKKASADGSVIVAHNEDDYGDIIVNVRKIRARDYGGPQKVSLGKGGVFETDGKTNGFLWIEAAGEEFADSFVNEHGVVITSDSCPSRETREDLTDGGIGWMLRRIMAEKARSAREAVTIAGELVERYGYGGSGRTYSIADKNEAWMLAVIRGRHWFAERVPDDEVAVIPNRYTIRSIRPSEPDRFMGSPDIVEYARKSGWYDEAKDGPFDFKKAFQRPPGPDPILDGNTLRSWRGLTILSGRKWETKGDYPFSFKPGKRVSAESLMILLRDHYEGTEYAATGGYKTGTPNHTKFRTICTASTINSFIAVLDRKRPEPISVRIWLAFGKPDTTIYWPLYYGVEDLPPGVGLGAGDHDYEILYRQHFDDSELRAAKDRLLQTRVLELQKLVEADYGGMIGTVGGELRPAETSFIASRAAFEADFSALYAGNKKEALKKLDGYVAAAMAKISGLYDRLLAKPPASR